MRARGSDPPYKPNQNPIVYLREFFRSALAFFCQRPNLARLVILELTDDPLLSLVFAERMFATIAGLAAKVDLIWGLELLIGRLTEATMIDADAVFLNILNRWEFGGAEPGRAGGAFGGERADVPALDAPLRGGGRGRALGPQARQGVGQAGPVRPGGGGGAALSRALSGFHRQALPRASGEGPWLWLGLHLDEAAPSVGGAGAQGAAQGGAPEGRSQSR